MAGDVAIKVRIEGDERLHALLADSTFIGGPLRDFLSRTTLTVEGKAKTFAPVDTGRLRSSIHSVVEGTEGTVGSNVVYAPFVEYGTRPHWPPSGALQPWARRHGFPMGRAGAFLVSRAIARRGTRAQPYLVPGLRSSLGIIRGFLRALQEEIRRRWRNG